MFFNGFVVHAGGVLRWEGTSDLVTVAVLVGTTLSGCALGWAFVTVRAERESAVRIPEQRSSSHWARSDAAGT
jgi:hypothetical protein